MQDIRAEAEEHIYKKLISKMDEFIELAHYDWTLRYCVAKKSCKIFLVQYVQYVLSHFV